MMEVTMKLIINADDLGFSKGVNYGIYDSFKFGIVSSTTLMMNTDYTDHAINLFKNEDIGIGVHLNITAGRALLDHKLLTDEDGIFYRNTGELTEGHIEEIKREFEAQIELAYDKHVEVTHLDSHHHIHMNSKELFLITKKLAKQYNIGIRCNKGLSHITPEMQKGIKSTGHFSSEFFNKSVNLGFLIHLIDSCMNEDTAEIMVHPGFLCGNLLGKDTYREMRTVEASILSSRYVKEFIDNKGIELINYGQL